MTILANFTHLFPPHHDYDDKNNGITGNRGPACSMGWRTYLAVRASPPRRAGVARRWAGAISRGGGIDQILVEQGGGTGADPFAAQPERPPATAAVAEAEVPERELRGLQRQPQP